MFSSRQYCRFELVKQELKTERRTFISPNIMDANRVHGKRNRCRRRNRGGSGFLPGFFLGALLCLFVLGSWQTILTAQYISFVTLYADTVLQISPAEDFASKETESFASIKDRLRNPSESFAMEENQLEYPSELFPRSNRTKFGIETMANNLLHVVALGVDGQIWHTFEERKGKWHPWTPLTTVCPSGRERERPCKFDGDPVVTRNLDGRLEVFMRFEENLDLWQMHQLRANDPNRWSMPRESSCVDQDQETTVWFCLGSGSSVNQSSKNYWIVEAPVFPTSDLTALRDEVSGKIQVFFRNFEGHLFMVEQLKAGNSMRYSVPQIIAPEILFV